MEVAVDQWRPAVERTEVEEVVEFGLQARPPRHQSSIVSEPDISSDTGGATVVHGLRKGNDGDGEPTANSSYLDINGGALEDLDIPKILNAAQHDAKKNGETETAIASSEEGSEVIDEEIEEEEVVELEFENAIPKRHTHTMHCPNCDYHITKVVLRRKIIKKKSVPITGEQEDPVHLVGCLSCFSLFVPKGNGCFDPFSIFRSRSGPATQQVGNQGEVISREEGNCFSIFRVFKRGPSITTKEDTPQESQEYTDDPSLGTDQPPIDYVKGKSDGSNVEGETDGIIHAIRYPSRFSQGSVNTPQQDELKTDVVPDTSTNSNQIPIKYVGDKRPIEQEKNDLPISIGYWPNTGRLDKQPPKDESKIDVVPDTSTPNQDQIQILVQQDSTSFEIFKSIVYGGLMEIIASLSIVVSASASGATTLNIIALALANLIGGIIIIAHNLWDLRDDCYKFSTQEAHNKYKELLGQIDHFPLHVFVAILSFLVFGIIPPVAYGYSFHETNDRDLTVIMVAVVSLLCVGLLAIFRAYIDKCNGFFGYVKVILYYMTAAVSVSGVSYVAGNLVTRLIEALGLFETGSGVDMRFVSDVAGNPSLAYY